MRIRHTLGVSAVAAVATLIAACTSGTVSTGDNTGAATSGGGGAASSTVNTSAIQKGGTLKVLGQSDIFNLDPVSAYYTVSSLIGRAFTRQLFSYDSSGSFDDQLKIVPDVATTVPTDANGGLADGGKTMTVHLRNDVMWNTKPARAVTAADFVREFKLLCNPASPTGALGYFTSTIVGMQSYCTGFSKVKPDAAAIKSYVDGHKLPGVVASDDTTLVFHLLNPTPDFLNILAMGFCSARPVEYMQYVPDSPPLRAHTISDAPYQITNYTATKSITLAKNPAWTQASDPLRHQYVDAIDITEGLNADNVQQQLQAGTGDMGWDVAPPAQALPQLESQHDPNLTIGPSGGSYVDLGTYIAMNQYHGPMTNKLVREAVAEAVDKNAIVQILGGSSIAATTSQIILPGSTGYAKGFNPFPDNTGSGNPAKAKSLLQQAGYKSDLPVKLIYSTTDPMPRVAQAMQASLDKAGFAVKLVPATQSDFYGKYLENPSTAKAGAWDLAPPGWIPDWFGNNGRSTIVPLLTAPGPGSNDFGGYQSKALEKTINKALTATDPTDAAAAWQQANKMAVSDAAIIPVNVQKWPIYHSSAVQNCNFFWYTLNCDFTQVWLKR